MSRRIASVLKPFLTPLVLGGGGALLAYQNRPAPSLWPRPLLADTPFDPLDPHPVPHFKPSKWDPNWDHRAPPTDSEKKPTATRHLILIRHGQYNLEGVGDAERKLTPLGRQQATLTGKRLKALGLKLDKINRSSMTRAMETADLIAAELDADIPLGDPDDILREGYPIKPEPQGGWHPDFQAHTDGARIEASFRKYFHRAEPEQKEDSYELVVCHANVIRYFVCRALQVDPAAWLRISLKHASLTWVTISPAGNVSMRCIGDAGHFEPEKLTTT